MALKQSRSYSSDAQLDWLVDKIAQEIGRDYEGNPSRTITIRALIYRWVEANHPEWMIEYQPKAEA